MSESANLQCDSVKDQIKYVVLITHNYPNFNEFITIEPTTEKALSYIKDTLTEIYNYIIEDDPDLEQTLDEYIIDNLENGEYHLEIIYGIDYDTPIYLNYNKRKFFYKFNEKGWILTNDKNKLDETQNIQNCTFEK